jgi:hypothetical protein
MIDINKYIPGRPRQLFVLTFSIFFFSTVLLAGMLFLYRPLKPVIINVRIDRIRGSNDGKSYTAMLTILDRVQDQQKMSGPLKLIFTDSSGINHTLKVILNTGIRGNRDTLISPVGIALHTGNEKELRLADGITGQLIILERTAASLVTSLIN